MVTWFDVNFKSNEKQIDACTELWKESLNDDGHQFN